ncbi:MAG TPA: FHA domain-containing protein [Fredinandcohnia sp.]|nr:FHA domain-containing protein [Fredinandcohnia sp.]
MRVVLRIESEGRVETRTLQPGVYLVGRDENADLRLEDAAASRRHLRLRVDEEVRVEELGSRNGTELGGCRLEGEATWHRDTTLRVGATLLRWTLEDEEPVGDPSRGVRALVRALRVDLRSRRSRRAAAILLCVSAVCGLVGAMAGSSSEAEVDPAPRIVRVSMEAVEGRVVGRDDEADLRVGERVEIAWRPRRDPAASLVWLHLGAETSAPGLRLEWNGVELHRWAPGDAPHKSLVVPHALLRDENRLVVEAPSGARWAVWDLRVEEEPRPPCAREACIESARELILQGRASRARSAVDEGNLHAAWIAFRRARALLEGLEPKPELYATAVGLMEEAEGELDALCRDLRFNVIQSLAFGREERARRFAERMRRAFPSAEHPCHQRAEDLLRKLDALGESP